jgi:hypothetical protein
MNIGMDESNLLLQFPTGTSRKFSQDSLARLEKMDEITRISHFPWKDGSEVFDPDLNNTLRSTRIPTERKQAIIDANWVSMTQE